jgi:regulator of RNase E activity RraA
VSDALDECGIAGVALLRPTDPKARVVGQAVTVLNVRRKEVSVDGKSRLGEIEAHNLAEPGDVLVVQGVAGISSMGGISASIGKRQGESGAVVDGAVRDIAHSRDIGYPVWSSGVSPVTGKWRIQTVAVNKPVTIAGMGVHPGDLVVADECGVCFVPHARAAEVLEKARQIEQSEKLRLEKLAAGMPLAEFAALQKK